MRLTENKIGFLLLTPLIIMSLLVSGYPIAASLWISLTDLTLASMATGKWAYVGLENYAKAMGDFIFHRSAIVSLQFVAESVIFIVVASIGMALILNERFRGSGILKVIVIVPWAISEFSIGIIGSFFYNPNFGLFNSILQNIGIIGPGEGILWLSRGMALHFMAIFYTWEWAPLGAFFILSALQTVPEDLYKQAKIDGASAFRRFRSITFPFIRYAVLIVLVLITMEAGRATVIMHGMTGGGPGGATQTATYYSFVIFLQKKALGYGSAISWIIMLFLIVAAVVYFTLLTRRAR